MFKRKPVAKAMRREEFLRRQFEARGEGGERTRARYADESTKGDWFKGDPDQLAKLKEGVEAWNAWREENPDAEIDLRGADLGRANLSGADLEDADLYGAYLLEANLSGADLGYSNLSGAILSNSNLSGADLGRADLSGAYLWEANISGAALNLANFSNTDVSFIRYRKRLLRNRCHGARVSECFGDAQFRRDVMDQDILDQRISQIRDSAASEAYSSRWWLSALVNGIKPLPILAGLVAGLLLKAMIFPVDAASLFARLAEGHYTDILSFWPFVAGGIGVAVFLAGTLGRLFGYWVWSLFDFGRDWDRVILFAFVMVLAFGGLYAHLDAAHQVALNWPEGDDKIWFYPWFTALMGFATLGIADFVTPITNLGAVVIMANVLSGFVTLGLLLSVLGDGFARRS